MLLKLDYTFLKVIQNLEIIFWKFKILFAVNELSNVVQFAFPPPTS